jgi:hypothetical protein
MMNSSEKRIGEMKAALDKDNALLLSLERDLAARRKDRDDEGLPLYTSLQLRGRHYRIPTAGL